MSTLTNADATSVDSEEASRLSKAVMDVQWKSVIDAYKKGIRFHTTKLFGSGTTALHLATEYAEDHDVKSLIDIIKDKPEDHLLKIVDDHDNTPLHLAARLGLLKKCETMAAAVPCWLRARNKHGETPLYASAYGGNTKVFLHLDSRCDVRDSSLCTRTSDGSTVLHEAIRSENFELAYRILHIYLDLATTTNKNGAIPLSILASSTTAFASTTFIVWWKAIIYYRIEIKKEMFLAKPEFTSHDLKKEKIPDTCPANYATGYNFFVMMKNIIQRHACHKNILLPRRSEDRPRNEEQTHHPGDEEQVFALRRRCRTPPNYRTLMAFLSISFKLLWSTIYRLSGSDAVVEDLRRMKTKHIWSALISRKLVQINPRMISVSSTLIAAQNGVQEVLEEILKVYPEYIWVTNEFGKNILHLAVENSQVPIVQMLHRNKNFHLLVNSTDSDGNTVLHLATAIARDPYRNRRSAYFHLKRQAEWFKYIEKLAPTEFQTRLNGKGQTPNDVLREQQQNLIGYSIQAPNASSVVASVIAAAAFSTTSDAFGSNNSEGKTDNNANSNGGDHPSSLLLGMSSLVGLVFSIASMMIFLEIITSQGDITYIMELSKKNARGRYTLTVSIAAMIIYFLAANYNMVKGSFANHHLLKTIYAAAFLPLVLSLVTGILIDTPLRARLRIVRQPSVDRLIKLLEKQATSTGEFAAS